MLTLIENGDLYDPEPLGHTSILIDNDKIIKVGSVDRRGLDLIGVEYEVINASGCLVTPGLIDPHQHLLGGSGEGSLSKQSPMLFLSEIVPWGITTVVGVLGVDTTMKTMAGLLARVKALSNEGLTARMWSGGYNVPPTTVLDSIREDMLFIDEIIGAGEVAISDQRSLQQDTQKLAQLVLDTHVGGLLSGKAGRTHFHVGPGKGRLQPLRDVLERFDVEASWLYPTHITRSPELLAEAVDLARQGAFVDMDTVEGGLAKWVQRYRETGGDLGQLTVSSDSGSGSPGKLFREVRACVVEHGMALEDVLQLVTSNTVKALQMPDKGHLQAAKDGDVVVLEKGSLEIVEVIARGQRMVREGRLVVREHFLPASDRKIHLTGAKEA